jgi:hypothetical protein
MGPETYELQIFFGLIRVTEHNFPRENIRNIWAKAVG